MAQGNARIDNVFNDEDILPFDVVIEVLTNFDVPRRFRRSAITGTAHKVEIDRAVDGAGQIGKEGDGSFQDAAKEDRLSGIIFRNLGA